MPRRAKFAAFLACFTALSACSLFVSLDGLSGGSAGDSGIGVDGSSSDAPAGDSAPPNDASALPDTNFLDDFNRPDNALLDNSWIEKRPVALSLSNNAVLRGDADTFDYPDNMVYRPPSEDVQDTTISLELTFASMVVGFPQIHSRIQQNSIGAAGTVDSYLFYINVGAPTVAMLARTRGFETLSNLGTVSLTDALVPGEHYRLTLKVSGRNPVSLFGTVEHFVSGSWVVIGQGSTIDADPLRLDDAGSTGFSASVSDGDHYQYDNFTRTQP